MFYFAPQKLWYLVFQDGNAAYSTNPDIADPTGWSAPRHFYTETPTLIQHNLGTGYWIDMWVICDDTHAYLFSSDTDGHLYRSRTTLADFPSGMSQPVIAAQDRSGAESFTADNVYRITGTDQYLLLTQAFDSDGRSYLRSWTSAALSGAWTPLSPGSSEPFAGAENITFAGTPWTSDIGQGELLRDGNDQTLTIDPCRLQFLYHGTASGSSREVTTGPWRLGLLTQTNSTCS